MPKTAAARTATTTSSMEELAKLIPNIARQIHRRLPKSVDVRDLEQAGYFGVVEALEQFNPSFQASLEHYTKIKIRSKILDYLRKQDTTSRDYRRKKKNYGEVVRQFANKHGHSPSSEELAAALGTSMDKLRKLEKQISTGVIAVQSFSSISADEPDVIVDPADTRTETTSRELILEQRDALIHELLHELKPRDRLILKLFMESNLTMKEVGELMNLAESRISQIVKRARETIAPALIANNLSTY